MYLFYFTSCLVQLRYILVHQCTLNGYLLIVKLPNIALFVRKTSETIGLTSRPVKPKLLSSWVAEA